MRCEEWKIPYEKPAFPGGFSKTDYPPLLAALLCKRGFTDKADADRFLFTEAEILGDPMLLPDMQKALKRIGRAVQNGEKITIYGDYDVDGITAACMLSDYLRKQGPDCEIYIPDRMEEGYGLNTAAVDSFKAGGTSLVITVDCGVTATEEAARAARAGVDMVITDHHECREKLPEAAAVINPKRPDSPYPGRELAGVGVAFKLMCAMDGDPEALLAEYSDLIAVGTVADVVPLTGENRYLVKAGLEKLKNNPRPGLAALLRRVKPSAGGPGADTIGYFVAPMINAAGRLGCADVAVSLLTAKTDEEAEARARELSGLNRRRRELEKQIWEQVTERLKGKEPSAPIVLADDEWHPGVIGITASRAADLYGLPAVIIRFDGDVGKGSCRSRGDFNMTAALNACSEHLLSYGGHASAAGLNIQREKTDDFRLALEDYYRKNPPAAAGRRTEPDLRADDPEMLSEESVKSLDLLEPFGSGNPKPLLCVTDAVIESVTPLKGGKHLRINASKFGKSFECVFFSQGPEGLGVSSGDYADLAFFPQVNEFRREPAVQLVLTDIRKFDGDRLRGRITARAVSAAEAGEIFPCRADFEEIWKSFRLSGGRVRGSLPEIMQKLGVRMSPGKFYVCVSVFDELGLLKLSDRGEELSAEQTETVKKTDLNTSGLMKILSGSAAAAGGDLYA